MDRADLDRGFIRPEYASQVIVSYFQAGKICDYIQERWGADTLVDMIHAYAKLTPTPEVIQRRVINLLKIAAENAALRVNRATYEEEFRKAILPEPANG